MKQALAEHILNIKVCSIFPDFTSFPHVIISESHFVIISGSPKSASSVIIPGGPKLASAVLCWKTTCQFLGEANQQHHK